MQTTYRTSLFVTFTALLLTSTAAGCGSEAPQDAPALSVTEATGEQCPYGGQVILIGDAEHVVCQGAPGEDGEAPEIEISDATAEECAEGGVVVTLDGDSHVICDGEDGEDGDDGEDGEAAMSVVVRAGEADSAQCEFGGTFLEFGHDTNANGALDDDEEVVESTAICNGATGEQGAPGEDGAPGLNSAMRVSAADVATCEFGGTLIEFGLDANANGTLDAEEAVLQSDAICHGAPGEDGLTPQVTLSNATSAECPGGEGTLLTIGEESTLLCPLMVVRASDLPTGALLVDNATLWNDAPLEWRLVHHNYGDLTNAVTLRTTESVASRGIYNSDWSNSWDSSDLRLWLNSTFADAFSVALNAALAPTTVAWTSIHSGSVSTGEAIDPVFIASRTELGGEAVAGEGSVLDWFADPATAAERRIESATPGQYWTRTGMWTTYSGTEYAMSAWLVNASGDFVTGNWTSDSFGIWPLITIDGDTLVVQRESDRFEMITLD
ncbi:hypothetical protein EA187_08610 [Lujinxingia sediminis]|uniref:Collagen-like protein n=1 Tax=Lujinxingia sediminis TaxID=2480984 RepID=A0ABY0CV76_9DELT|nr:DUF6273 domain-containing protein [Lujinxingia sediminis]RVU45811.1 hypothetical protein EA187_08610 [Lujinxingia sediminis]